MYSLQQIKKAAQEVVNEQPFDKSVVAEAMTQLLVKLHPAAKQGVQSDLPYMCSDCGASRVDSKACPSCGRISPSH